MNPPDTRSLFNEICALMEATRAVAAQQINTLAVLTRFEVGRRIVLHEQGGEVRAEYGKAVLKTLSRQLTQEFGRGWSVDSLTLIRRFYLSYQDRSPKSETVSRILSTSSTPSLFTLSWSHYVFLIGVENMEERRFYEVEATQSGWSLRELRRQFDSSLYERLALSRDKEDVRTLAEQGQLIEKPSDMLKSPYVLEFLGLEERPRYTESELESGIIDKLEQFMLELGKGFLFEGRQRRFTFDEEHYYVDLAFYNRLLRCFVLIDLKIGKITHQDLGQMQMYVNYYDRHIKLPEESPTVGIILCK